MQKPLHQFCTLGFAIAVLSTIAVFAAVPEKGKKIVVIAGKPSHPSGQHEFNAGAMILAKALNEQSGLPHRIQVVSNGWPEDESVFEGADAVVVYSDGKTRHAINGHELTLDALTKKGVGLMFMHFAVDVPRGEQGEYFKKWIGGHYEGGFSCNPHWTAPVELDNAHPVANGVPNFTVNDEWYYNIRFADPKTARDLLTSVPTRERINRYIHWTKSGEEGLGKKQTLMWAVEREDGGRGIGFTGGHWHRNWAIDDFRRTLLNAIVWLAKGEVPESGVNSLPVTEAQLNENLDPKKKMEHISLPSESDLNQTTAEPKPYGKAGRKK